MTEAERPIRVALDGHVIGRRGTGNETYVIALAKALRERDDVRPIVLLDRDAPWRSPGPMDLHRLRVRSRLVRLPIELAVAARATRADLLHVQYVAPPVAGIPVVAAIHDLSFEDVPGLFPRRTELRLKLSVRATARRAAAIVAISEFTRGRLIERYRVDPERVFTTPVAVSEHWRPTTVEERAATLDRLGIDGPFVLAVGNLHPRKNLPRLIRAMAAVRSDALADVRLVLVGQTQWRAEEIERSVDAHGAGSWITQTGFIDDESLRALYGAARAVAHVSLYEGLGLPVLEAMACDAVVLASDTTAIPEAAGGAALLVDPTRDDAVAEGLARILTDDALRAELLAAGRCRVASLTPERFAAATMTAYRAALA